ncbi:MAG TPA: HIT domain-containing protein [Methylomirabilota bacterium]|jgi:ATP adenylyltransferase|nr:HIT domain-containing protein [Methylomirabilota bacterium]
MSYVSGAHQPEGCLFCTALAAGDDAQHRILDRSRSAFLILNTFPYSSGHLMIAPNRHAASPEDLDDQESLDLMRVTRRALAALRAVYRPDGFNLGVNMGRAAGAGIEGHFHLHVVPRWAGDTNFMPVVGAVKVIPESLDETYRRLRVHLSP